jgi:hypothetical protein
MIPSQSRYVTTLIFAIFIAFSHQVIGYAEETNQNEVQKISPSFRAAYGQSRFIGDLSGATGVATSIYSGSILSDNKFLKWGFKFDVLGAKLRHDGNRFPFESKAKLEVLCFLLQPIICTETGDTQFCTGLGVGNVNVNSAQDRRDYGSWHYEASIRHQIYGPFSIEAITKYVGKVEQRVKGVEAEFSFVTYAAGIAVSDL